MDEIKVNKPTPFAGEHICGECYDSLSLLPIPNCHEDMLKALKDAMTCFRTIPADASDEFIDAYKRVKAAIAKAENGALPDRELHRLK